MTDLATSSFGYSKVNPAQRRYFKGGKKMQDGKRRMGKPRTDAERRKRHKSLYGTSKLPPRGTGLRNLPGMSVHPVVNCSQGSRRQVIEGIG